MPLKKSFSKSKNICKVTFNYPANKAKQVTVAGDFNGWDTQSLPMKKTKDVFSVSIELDAGKEYEFRYFVDGVWANDTQADGVIKGPYPDCENCVLSTRQQQK